MATKNNGIGIQKESSLHRALKQKYTQPGGTTEIPVDGYICDIVNPKNAIIEIQTKHLSALYQKLVHLLPRHKITVIHPIAATKYITRTNPNTGAVTNRKSPRHGTYADIFSELTALYPLLNHRNFTLKAILVTVTEHQIADGTGSWRRKGSRIDDRELIDIQDERTFRTTRDYAALIPDTVPVHFTVKDLKKSGFAAPGKSAWVLRHMNAITLSGKNGRAYTYTRTDNLK